MKVTQQDIAEALKISPATVSRALKGHQAISDAVKLDVLRMADQLGYQLNATARKRSGVPKSASAFKTIGALICAEQTMQGAASNEAMRMVSGMASAAQRHGVVLTIHRVHPGQHGALLDDLDKPMTVRRNLLNGAIFVQRFDPEVILDFVQRMPCVRMVHGANETLTDVITSNVLDGYQRLIAKLVEMGHREFGFATNNHSFGWSQERFGAVLQILSSHSIRIPSERVINVYSSIGKRPQEVIPAILECHQKRPATAWIFSSDSLVESCMLAFAQLGYSVPGEVSLAGFDHKGLPVNGLIPTSIAPDFESMGEAGVDQLLQLIAGESSTRKVIAIPPSVFWGDTITKVSAAQNS